MISFPSSLNESGAMYNSNKAASLKDSFDIERLKAINLNTSVPIIQDQLKEESVNISNFNKYSGSSTVYYNEFGSIKSTDYSNYNQVYFENPINIPMNAIALMKDYDWIYKYQVNSGVASKKSGESLEMSVYSTAVVPSMFNGLYGVRVKGFIQNTPLLNDVPTNDYDINVDDCSIRTLCALSKQVNSPLGMQRFKYSDFMYCKNLGKVANNHLIVLRKFAHPIQDHIGKGTNPEMNGDGYWDWKTEGDVGRLISWFDTDDNKLEDIIKFSYGSTWKELNAEIQQEQSNAENSNSGILGMISNTLNPSYNSAAADGHVGSHSLIGWLGGQISPLTHQGEGQNINLLSNYDTYKVYTPKNTIQSNHVYEGKIQFQHEFQLTFSYELRGYDNINPRSAFLDLLGNILEVTGRRGKFWGGDRKVIGPAQDLSMYNKVGHFIDKGFDKIPGFLSSFSSGSSGFSNFLGQLGSFGQDLLGSIKEKASEAFNKAKDPATWENMGNLVSGKLVGSGALNAVKGLLKNTLGRPQLYAWHSLVSGDDVGLWHVTIGNPKNPILSIGNLIMTNAEVTQYGPLGLDDFPTGLKVVVSLKHPRPRDISDIGRMYTGGTSALYQHFARHNVEDFFGGEKQGENPPSLPNSDTSVKSGETGHSVKLSGLINDTIKNIRPNMSQQSITSNDLPDVSLNTYCDRRLHRTNSFDNTMLLRMIHESA